MIRAWFKGARYWRDRALAAEREIALVRDELRSTGHRADATTPLNHLVDMAIDAERSRRETDVIQAADAARLAVLKRLPLSVRRSATYPLPHRDQP